MERKHDCRKVFCEWHPMSDCLYLRVDLWLALQVHYKSI